MGVQAPSACVDQVPAHLSHERLIRVYGNPGNRHNPSLQCHNEEHVLAEQFSRSPYLDEQEVRRQDLFPMHFQKALPGRRSIRRWPDPVLLDDV